MEFQRNSSALGVAALFFLGTQHSLRAAPAQQPRHARREATVEPVSRDVFIPSIPLWTPLPTLIGGQVIFNAGDPGESAGPAAYLVTKRVLPGSNANQGFSSQMLRGISGVADLEVSPDGHSVLLKVGSFEGLGSSVRLYIWDTLNPSKNARQGPLEEAYSPEVFWSPEGHYIIFYTGTLVGFGPSTDVSLTPVLYDTRTGRSRRLKSIGANGLAWTRRKSLLSVGPYLLRSKTKNGKVKITAAETHSSIYETSLETGVRKLVVQNARSPFAESPDGQWIAFQGWPEVINEREIPGSSQTLDLYLYNRIEKKRYLVATSWGYHTAGWNDFLFDELHWSSDSKSLVVVRGHDFYKVEIPSRSFKWLTALPVEEGDSLNRNYISPIKILGFTKGDTALVAKNAPYKTQVSVQTIDLNDGKISTLARIKDARGVAWVSQPPKN